MVLIINSVFSRAYGFEEEKCQIVKVKACVDDAIRMIDGHESKQKINDSYLQNICWKYEEQFRCVSKETNNCMALEENRGCTERSTNCLDEGNLGLCKKLEKTFSCGSKLDQEKIEHLDTQFHVKRDEKDLSNCTAEEVNKYCDLKEEKCVEPSETRNINGKDIHKDCWKWDREYICRTDTFIDECKSIPENCKIIGEPECLHFNKNDNICDHKEIKYQCNENATLTKECKTKEFCLGGICEKTTRNKHNDFGNAISKLSVLAQMKSNGVEGCRCPNGRSTCDSSEIDPSSCKFFTGNGKKCTKATAQFNCCTDKGFLRKPLGNCDQEEQDLFQLRKANLCHHVGSWRGKKIQGFKKYQSHCCFKSRLAKIIQIQGRKQLGIGWGYKKSPDCRSLTLEEIRRIDFSKIDFTELYTEIVDKSSKSINQSKNNINQKMGGYKDGAAVINDKSTSKMINEKIKNFYGAKK
jgi:conjugal transfer mating pair stabilization protein TraN